MAFSTNKCQALADKIDKAEQALDDYLMGERALNIQDGNSIIGYQAGSGIEAGLRRRIAELKGQYKRGSCPVVLGHDDIDLSTSTPKAIKPVFGHR